jgi:hypothetical protein
MHRHFAFAPFIILLTVWTPVLSRTIATRQSTHEHLAQTSLSRTSRDNRGRTRNSGSDTGRRNIARYSDGTGSPGCCTSVRRKVTLNTNNVNGLERAEVARGGRNICCP